MFKRDASHNAVADAAGRTWKIRLDRAALARVRRRLGVDLTQIDFDRLGSLVADGPRLVAVAYAVVEPRADRLGITPEDFGRALADPDVIMAVAFALAAELAELSPYPAVRLALRRVIRDHKASV